MVMMVWRVNNLQFLTILLGTKTLPVLPTFQFAHCVGCPVVRMTTYFSGCDGRSIFLGEGYNT